MNIGKLLLQQEENLCDILDRDFFSGRIELCIGIMDIGEQGMEEVRFASCVLFQMTTKLCSEYPFFGTCQTCV